MCHHISNAVYLVGPEVCLAHGGSTRYDAVTAENAKQGVLPPHTPSMAWFSKLEQGSNFIFTSKKVHRVAEKVQLQATSVYRRDLRHSQRSCQGRSLMGRFAVWTGQELPTLRRVAAPQSSASSSPRRRQYEPPKFYILLTVHLITVSWK